MAIEPGSGDVVATVRTGDVEWEYEDGTGAANPVFEAGHAVAALLAHEVAFVNAPWYRNDLPEADRAVARILVGCNDVFAWATADAEPLPMAQVARLYRMWRADPTWGSAAWAIMTRGTPPQGPVAERLRSAGIWDPDRLVAREGDVPVTGEAYVDARLADLPLPEAVALKGPLTTPTDRACAAAEASRP